WVIMPLHYIQGVVLKVFASRIPGVSRAIVALPPLDATYAQAFALAQGIERKTLMLTNDHTFRRFDRARMRRQIPIQELAKRPFPNKTNTGRILLGGIGQLQRLCNASNLGLGNFAQREQGMGQLTLIKPMQEIALIFA